MSVRINISQNWFKSGSSISGTVSLHGDEDIDINTLNIRFVGSCDTQIDVLHDEFEKVQGRAPLFEYMQVLFKGPRTMHPGLSWPFHFTIPSHSVANQPESWLQQKQGFNIDPSQDLPPSFSDQCVHGTARVTYTLVATLTSWKSFTAEKVVHKTLTLPPTREIEASSPSFIQRTQTLTCRSLHLQPQRDDKPLTFKEKLIAKRTSKLPAAVFNLHMLLPTFGVTRQHLPMILRIEHDSDASTATMLPIVLLKECVVQLLATTHVQYPGPKNLLEVQGWTTSHGLSPTLSSEVSRKPIPVTEHTDLSSFLQLVIPAYHVPNFSTFNVRRNYKLRIQISVECAQKTLKAEFVAENFTLLAADYMPNRGATAEVSNSTVMEQEEGAPGYDDRDDVPPPYEGQSSSLPSARH